MQKSLGLIETQGLAGGITAADAAVKSANVRLIGYELTKGGGWTTVKIEGDVGAVKAAVDAAKAAAGKMCRVVSTKVIPRPAVALDQLVFSGDTVGCNPPEPPKEPDPPAPPEPPVEPDEPVVEEAAPVPEPEPAPEPEGSVPAEPEPVPEPEGPVAEPEPAPEAPAEPVPEPPVEEQPAPEGPAEEPAPAAESPAEESKPKAARKAPAKRGKRKQ